MDVTGFWIGEYSYNATLISKVPFQAELEQLGQFCLEYPLRKTHSILKRGRYSLQSFLGKLVQVVLSLQSLILIGLLGKIRFITLVYYQMMEHK